MNDIKSVTNNTNTKSNKLRWTDAENEIMRQNYSTMGTKVADLLPGRSRAACRHQADILNLANKNTEPYVEWTDKEDAVLRRFYPSMGSRVAALLPGRSKRACYSRAKKLKLKYF